MTVWQQLAVRLSAGEAETATDILEAHGALSVTVSAASDEPLFVAHAGEVAEGEAALWTRCAITALFAEDAVLDDLRHALTTRFASAELHQTTLTEADWLAAAAGSQLELSFGAGRLLLRPRAARDGAPANAPPTVYLDAGLAFGSGSHPTTQMCLDWLASVSLEGCRVLDYGCGSGILAIAAARLGAAQVVGVDIDAQALLATRDNALYNSVPEARLEVLTPDAFLRSTHASHASDIVVANILANPLIALSDVLSGALAPGGRLCLTGLLADQAEAVIAAYPSLDLAVREEVLHDGATWVRVEGGSHAAA